jgi:ATP/maltotriose-dependent transcriptional regulator MalT
MEREIQWATKEGNAQGGGLLAYAAAGRAFNSGSLKRARELTTQAARIAKENKLKDNAAEFMAFQGLMEAQAGNFAQAKERAAASLAVSRVRNNLPMVALTLASAGDSSQAQRITEELKTRYPADTAINNVFIPCTLATLESNRGNAAKAIELLQATSRYERGASFGLNPIYIRGLTYLREKKGQEAAAEFQKILDLRALGASAPVFSLSKVGIARAYALTGDTAKSRKFYQDFLALWKDADPDIPILKEAKAEYAKLQ